MQIKELLVTQYTDLLLSLIPIEHNMVSVRGAGLRLQIYSILKRWRKSLTTLLLKERDICHYKMDYY